MGPLVDMDSRRDRDLEMPVGHRDLQLGAGREAQLLTQSLGYHQPTRHVNGSSHGIKIPFQRPRPPAWRQLRGAGYDAFISESSYHEYPAPTGLRPLVACLWEQRTTDGRTQRVVPDGCVDLLWLSEGELVVAGADTGPRLVELPARTHVSGVRFRPGAAGAVLGVPASGFCDRQVPAEDVWGRKAARLAVRLASAPAGRRLALLADAVAERGAEPDALVLAATRRLADPGARVGAVAADLGVAERTLHRRTLAAVGYAPKVLARVARLRRLVATTDDSLSSRAFTAGYASQAHMSQEVRRLTGTTPVRFLKDAALTAA
jgi:AraC-like DNA-binding protein